MKAPELLAECQFSEAFVTAAAVDRITSLGQHVTGAGGTQFSRLFLPWIMCITTGHFRLVWLELPRDKIFTWHDK